LKLIKIVEDLPVAYRQQHRSSSNFSSLSTAVRTDFYWFIYAINSSLWQYYCCSYYCACY